VQVWQRPIIRIWERVTIGLMRFVLLMAVTVYPALMFDA
jgi:hypothetical protein